MIPKLWLGVNKLTNSEIENARIVHEKIKMRLRIRGNSLAKIAKLTGVSGTSMTLISLGKHRSNKIEVAIARALNTTPSELWPDRFNEGEGLS